ncbi:MAG: S41 family peptidase [Bacteroidales bacterium]|nr:MAG: S41 family peptidase [Bacteroidales bacterium]
MNRLLPVGFLILFLQGGFVFGQIGTFEQSLKIGKILDLVNNYYVDTVNQEKLVEGTIIKMLQELDPHSVYIPRDEVKEMNEPLQGNFEGIGIQFNILFDTILVISPVPGGPSEKVGIQAGDRIVEIEGENVAGTGMTTGKVRERLLGEKGTKVSVKVKRKRTKEWLDFTITRDRIPINSLDAAYIVDDRIGYIKLNRFSFTTLREFNRAIDELQKQNITDLILDLRNNGGGYMEIAVHLADQFLPDKKLIVYMKGENVPKKEYLATAAGKMESGRLVILIDEGSASASEIVAGAIQDWDRGIILGRRSFGKGLVQRPFTLTDGSMIRLTIARYYTPTGRLIQKPYDDGFDKYIRDLTDRYQNGELNSVDSIRFPDSLKYRTLIKNRIVYGGGGIMPDLFVALDTSGYSNYYRKLSSRGIINSFTLDYVDKNREALTKKYTDFQKFKQEFDVTDAMLENLTELALKEGVEHVPEDFEISKSQIKLIIKGLIARDIWDMSEFYEVVNTEDPAYQKAVLILNNNDEYLSKLEGD